MSFLDEIVTILEGANVGLFGESIFIGPAPNIAPAADGFITIKPTGGAGPEGTHNSLSAPAYVRPAAQIVARSNDYAIAESMILNAYAAMFVVRNQFVNDVWWRSVSMKQEPFDLGPDEMGRSRIAFNFDCVKRPSTLAPMKLSMYNSVEYLGGDYTAYYTPALADLYLQGLTQDKFVPGSWPVVMNAMRLPAGVYVLEANARVLSIGTRAKVALMNLNNPDVPVTEITFSDSQLVGERQQSASFVIPSIDTLFAVKSTVNSNAIGVAGVAAWGCRVMRTT